MKIVYCCFFFRWDRKNISSSFYHLIVLETCSFIFPYCLSLFLLIFKWFCHIFPLFVLDIVLNFAGFLLILIADSLLYIPFTIKVLFAHSSPLLLCLLYRYLNVSTLQPPFKNGNYGTQISADLWLIFYRKSCVIKTLLLMLLTKHSTIIHV